MPMLVDSIKPRFSLVQTEQICSAVLRSCVDSVDAAFQRDQDFLTWDRQAEGDPSWAGIPQRWAGSCYVEDPLTDEHIFETVAAIAYIQQQQDWWQCEAKGSETEDEQFAANIEAFLNDLVIETKLGSTHMYDLLENAARHSYGILAIEWEQTYTRDYTPVYRHKKSAEVMMPDDPDVLHNPQNYRLIEEMSERVENEGIALRVPYSGDVYFDPPTAQSIKEAERIIERFSYTASDLLDGVEALGFDEDQVAALLRSGPCSTDTQTYAYERDEIEGISPLQRDTWEVYRVIGRPPPLIEDGYSTIKASDRDRDYQWMVCPAHQVCFKFAPSPYARRPYAKYPFRGRAGRMIGHSVCSMVAPMQQETTVALRFAVDFRDMFFSSPTLVPDEWADEWERWPSYPGAILPYPTNPPMGPDVIKPLPVNPAGATFSMANAQDFRERASQLFSADARGPAMTQQRTATEAGQAAAGADEKLDLLLLNFHMGVEETAEVILSHYRQFAGSESIVRMIGAKSVEITPEALKKSYRIVAVGNSENASPMLRLHRNELLWQIAQGDPIIAQKVQQGDMTAIYAVLARLYRAVGIRNPASILGKEPTPPPTPDLILQTVLAGMQQFAQAGDPGCQQLLMQVSEMMQSQDQGQPAQAGGQQGNPQKISMSLNFKDLAGSQQDAFAQMVGLPPANQGQNAPRNGVGPQQPQGVVMQ